MLLARPRLPVLLLTLTTLLLPACGKQDRSGTAHAPAAPTTAVSAPAPEPTAPAATASPAPVEPAHPAPEAAPAPTAPASTAAASTAAASGQRGEHGGDGAALLALRPLLMPVQGVAPASVVDNYEQERGTGRHEAIDIMAPRGTPVLAVDEGKVAKLFTSKAGGLTVYQFDPEGKLAYYYAHLDRYAEGLQEGRVLRRGDPIGYVGVTGNAAPDAPHLHFAVFRLGPERQWWKGEPVNPYRALRNAQAAK